MSLFNELKRRNVIRVAIAYAVIAWVLMQIGDILFTTLELGQEPAKILLAILLLGFIPAVIFAWAFEITPEGIKKEKDVERDESVTNLTAKKLDMVTIGLLVVAIALFGLDRFSPRDIQTQSVVQVVGEANSTEQVDSNEASLAVSVNEISNKSIAVLPFANMANNAENEPFTVGLHDDLLTHLSRISALKVISRTSVMEYKDTTKKIKDIASELGVANILEGGVQRSGNQIRLNVQLIDANTDEHLWAEIYDRELTTKNIFKIQTEISQEIAKALKAQLTPAETKSIETAPTDNLEAYDAYLAARQLMEKREGNSLKQALALYQKAAELDPDYALAYVGQASALRLLREYSDLSYPEMFRQGEPLIAKALALDPLLADAHTIKAAYLDERQQFKEAEKSYLYALSLNPNNAQTYHWYGHMLRNDLGRFEQALALHRKAAKLDPLSRIILINIGWSLRLTNEIDEAKQQFAMGHQLYPDFPGALNGLAWVNDDVGNYAQAVIQQNKAIALDTSNILNRTWLSRHYLSMNDVISAKVEIEKAKEISPKHGLYLFAESQFDMFAGNYQAAQQRFASALETDSENTYIKKDLAKFTVLMSDCDSVVSLWRSAAPEIFSEELIVNIEGLYDNIDLAWCLKQTGQESEGQNLLEKAQKYMSNNPNTNFWKLFSQAGIYAAQGKPKQAAQAYADTVASKRTRGWHWLDHLPYYADTRKEPVFIKARQQLMQDLAEQRELLAEYRKNGKAK